MAKIIRQSEEEPSVRESILSLEEDANNLEKWKLVPEFLKQSYMTSQGRSDCPRSARYILKNYVNVLFCHVPPLHNPKTFQISFSVDTKPARKVPATNKKLLNKLNVLGKDFFKQRDSKSYISATTGMEE